MSRNTILVGETGENGKAEKGRNPSKKRKKGYTTRLALRREMSSNAKLV